MGSIVLGMNSDDIDKLDKTGKVDKVYNHSLSHGNFPDFDKIPVENNQVRGGGGVFYVRVANVEEEQKGKGRKRPQYKYTYTFERVKGVKMVVKKDKKAIKILESKLMYHKRKYYTGEPEISDIQYDSIEDELRKLDPKNPVLDVVGSDFSISKDGKVPHAIPMLSCKKAKDLVEVDKLNTEDDLTASYKVDGLSMSLEYEGGLLVRASTRGDGKVGDDVTLNAMRIRNVPKRLPQNIDIEVRGETYLPNSMFVKINKSGGNYSSPRNLASGTLKGDDSSLIAKRGLKFMAWDIISLNDETDFNNIDTYAKTWNLEELGFEVAEYDFVRKNNPKKIKDITEEITKRRDKLDFEVDGVVFKINNGMLRNGMGNTGHHPRWQIAWKFPSQGSSTTLNDIIWSVGRTGRVTPVASLDTVKIAGANISRATLNNVEFITTGPLKGLGIGDTVFVIRAGDVIPKVENIMVPRGKGFVIPDICPKCGTKLKRDGVDLICDNMDCPARQVGNVEHWIKANKIDGFGTETINILNLDGKLSTIGDIYNLNEAYLVDMVGKNGHKIYRNIQKAKTVEYDKMIKGLGLDFVGKGTATRIVKAFPHIDEFLNASLDDIRAVPDVGDRTAKSLYNGKGRFRDLLKVVSIKYPKKIVVVSKKLAGKKVYVSGKIFGMNKTQTKDFIESHSGIFKGFGKGLDMLIVGDKPGQSKLAKAKGWNMTLVDEQWLIDEGIKP